MSSCSAGRGIRGDRKIDDFVNLDLPCGLGKEIAAPRSADAFYDLASTQFDEKLLEVSQ